MITNYQPDINVEVVNFCAVIDTLVDQEADPILNIFTA